MGQIKYSKTIIIENKVFREDDIIHLARLFKEQYCDGDYERKIILCFDDESVISCDDIDVFSTDAFKRRWCKVIRFEYGSKGYDRQLKIELRNSSKCEVEVRSTDSVWYESMLNRIETAFNEVENQKTFVRYSNLIATTLSVIEVCLLITSLRNAFSIEMGGNSGVFAYGCLFAIVYLVNYVLACGLKNAYPSVEFLFGPEHRNDSLKRQRVIGLAVPFAIDVLFFILGLLI